MRLQITVEPAVEIGSLGKLAIVGTSYARVENEDGTSGPGRVVYFILVYTGDAPLWTSLHPQGGFDPRSLLFEIFIEQGCTEMESPTDPSQKFLVFTRKVDGQLRDPRAFLHATARKLAGELEEIEDSEQSLEEMEGQLNWVDEHYGRRDEMPNFARERHEAIVTE